MSAIAELISRADSARDRAQWAVAIALYRQVLHSFPQSASVLHNLALCFVGDGQFKRAIALAQRVLQIDPSIWQSHILLAKSQKALGLIDAADQSYVEVLKQHQDNPAALSGRADLALNLYGDPLTAFHLVKPLMDLPEYAMDARLVRLMASLYDRNADLDALALSQQVFQFADEFLQLPNQTNLKKAPARPKAAGANRRPRVGLLSNLFCVSPVYFLTIAGWKHVAKGCEIVILNRGHKQDWATQVFRDVASEWHDLQHMPALALAQTIADLEIDVLYDLGGWMDPIGLQALSLRPSPQQLKWVGGQSVTTGLHCFQGWIGDEWQSPQQFQHLYTEPLIQVRGGYAHYTPPDYLPKPSKHKSNTPCIFSNPAKVSRAFLNYLKTLPGKKVFIHRQYRFERTQHRIREALDNQAEFICPETHQEALMALNAHSQMIDTFPYSGGLTAREAMAMGTALKVVQVGELFCERHSAAYYKRAS